MNVGTGTRRLHRKAFAMLVVVVLAVSLLSPVLGTPASPALALGTQNAPLAEGHDPGPTIYLEFPPEGQVLPFLPVEIYVSTWDAQGIDRVSLRVNGQELPDARVTFRRVRPWGSSTLAVLRQEWMPPAEGEYIIEARGRNTAGTYGEPRYVKFCIVSCKPTKEPILEEIPLVKPTETPPPGGYDLYVDEIEFTPVNNIGTGHSGELAIVIATDTAPLGIYLSPDSSFQFRLGPDDYWQYADCSRSTQFSFCRVTLPVSFPQPGSYVIEVVADCDEEVSESDETNNYGRQTIVVGPKPAPTAPPTPAPGYDLYVRRMDFMQTNPVVGDTIDLSIMLATDIAPQGAAYYPASHFRWRQGANFPWQEEVCPDNFQYASCVKDVSFSYSQAGSYDVEVEADSRGSIAETDETNNMGTWTIMVGPALEEPPPEPPVVEPPPDEPEAELYFWADPSTIYAGQCATLYWEVSAVQAVYLDGEGVIGSDNRQVCPGATTAYTLQVVKEDGSAEERQEIVTVEGMIESPEYPPELPPDDGEIGSPEFPPEIPSPQDTTGPDISGVGVSWQDCQAYGSASISDDSGVSWAQFYFNLDGAGWQSLWMSDRGGGYWEADYPAQASGTDGYIEYYVVAGDNLGLESESGAQSGSYECYSSEIPQDLNF